MTAALALLVILFFIIFYHLTAIPETNLWGGDRQFLPILYSIGALLGQLLIALIYGAPYSAVVISGMGSLVSVILCFAKLPGLYDWIEKSIGFISIYYNVTENFNSTKIDSIGFLSESDRIPGDGIASDSDGYGSRVGFVDLGLNIFP
ncbi:unnamed protein product [Adineta ricciae]|uniref:Uncharacterized protein n=1 Tax=Adineta ricciae TaxID=249248 RepID=A0A815W0D4_ADIRI|nr:unnamed protein product [Adineta ricciae]